MLNKKSEISESNNKGYFLIIILFIACIITTCYFYFVPQYQENNLVNQAMNNLNAGKYHEAINDFQELYRDGYADADKYLIYCTALKHYENHERNHAVAYFSLIENFLDSGDYITYINALISFDELTDYNNKEMIQKLEKQFSLLGNFKNSKELKTLLEVLSDINNNKDQEADNKLNAVLENNAFDKQYHNLADNLSLFINAKLLFDKNDYSCLNTFEKLVKNNDALGRYTQKYVDYIKGKQYFEQEYYYQATVLLEKCLDIADSKELLDNCIQNRPDGIIYDKASSADVNLKITDYADNKDSFVKIYNHNNELISAIYIIDGKSCELKLSQGYYRFALATGDYHNWYGLKDSFGIDGTYYNLFLDPQEEYYYLFSGYEYDISFMKDKGNINYSLCNYENF